MSNFWNRKKVLVTGGAGFIGSHLVEKLIQKNAQVTVLDNLSAGKLANLNTVKGKYHFIKGDCTNFKTAYRACLGNQVVMNLAAKIAGVEYNKTHNATMLAQNLLIEIIMIDAARKTGVKRFLAVSSACVYPDNCSIPTPEWYGFLGEPDGVNWGYGWAKRMNEILGKCYRDEFEMKVGIVRPYNCYGPRDNFDPKPFHVVPSLIKRVLDGENPVIVWGSGRQTRAFLYVEDLIEGMILTIEKYAVGDPVNLGTNEEVTIKKLIDTIIKINGRDVKVVFDETKPDGSPRRNSNNTKAERMLGFYAKTKLEDGLEKTIKWYNKQTKSQ